MRLQFACLGKINMRQFVVTKAGLLIPEGLVATDGAVRFPREDNIEWGRAWDLGHVVKRIFRAPPGFMAFPFSVTKRARKS